MMATKKTLKDKILKMYRKNDSAGKIYGEFIKNKKEIEKREAIEIFIEFAKTENRDMLIRAKALAILGFFKSMSCGDGVDEFYEDGSIICGYGNIIDVIEDNCKEVIEILESIEKINLNENFEAYKIISQIIYCLHSYQIDSRLVSKLFDLLEEKLNLKEKKKSSEMDDVDSYIEGQIFRLRPKFKI
jgi:hypothetical protein